MVIYGIIIKYIFQLMYNKYLSRVGLMDNTQLSIITQPQVTSYYIINYIIPLEKGYAVMNKLGEMFSTLELASAKDLLNIIVPLEPFRDDEYSFQGNNQTYDCEFNGSLMKNGVYYDCQFTNVNFYGTTGYNSIIKNSQLDNCNMKNANFTYSNFTDSKLTLSSVSSTYDFSDFTDATILRSTIEASSFTECYFWNSKILNSNIKYCEFKKSFFYNCIFKELDLSMVTLDYSEFINPVFETVTLPFFGVLNLVSGFSQIVNQEGVSFRPSSSDYTVSGAEYIDDVRLLKPIFFYENNFIALANIYTYDGEIQNAYLAILNGLKYACSVKNFGLIRHFCRFASINNYFRTEHLKEFYDFLDKNLDVEQLGYVEYHSYLNELYMAKRLLIDCPFNRDIIEIELKTRFEYSNNKKLTETFRIINETLERHAPDSNNHITIRHNSPPDITIIVSDNIYVLYLVFFALQLIFCKSLNGIEKLQGIIKNRHEIKLHKLDVELKKLEIEKLKSEMEQKNSDANNILLPTDFKNISYIVKTYNDLPKELRKM